MFNSQYEVKQKLYIVDQLQQNLTDEVTRVQNLLRTPGSLMFCVSDSDVILSENSSTLFPGAICGDLLQYANNDETDHESMKNKRV